LSRQPLGRSGTTWVGDFTTLLERDVLFTALLFETETALRDSVPVEELVRQLSTAEHLPRLAFRASCFTASTERHEIQAKGRSADPSTSRRLVVAVVEPGV
jgi:hypothetical protein